MAMKQTTENCQCQICNNTQGHEFVFAREMMLGFCDEFLYFKCPVCGCLQINEIPQNLSKYYPKNYYSYQIKTNGKFKKMVVAFLVNAYMHGLTKLRYAPYITSLDRLLLNILRHFNKKQPILDIGCGAGWLLQKISEWGYLNLTGIDPFLENDILYSSGVKIFKQTINEHNGKYDLIMLHHSFEHMPEPHNVLKSIYKILNDDGILLIRIPVSDSFAYRKYQNNWYQLDAPRHLFLHTTKSMSYLAKNSGFIIKDIVYDSTEHQIFFSEKYCRDVNLVDEMKFTPEYIKDCKKFANYLNKIKDGDQCCFILEKNISLEISNELG